MNTLPDAPQPAGGDDLLTELLERPVGHTGGDDDPPEEETVYVIRWTDDYEPEDDDEDEPTPPPKVSAIWFWLGALLGLSV